MQSEESITFPYVARLEKYAGDYSRLGDDYIFSRITPTSRDLPVIDGSLRFDGFMMLVVMEGSMEVQINTRPFSVSSSSVMVVHHRSLLNILSVDWEHIDAYLLFISPQFLRDINIDINTLSLQSLYVKEPSPILMLNKLEEKVMAEYMHLMNHNAVLNANSVFSKSISRSLIQAILYQLMQIGNKITSETIDPDSKSLTRRVGYVKEFLSLLQLHHFRERTLDFYAEKLFISPKYLSRIIKEATGRSAAEWIDEFVILEAKNMLRFSNKNIQQIAYSLNFSTQSSFGKFFKHLTGMSPSEYQKT